MDRTHKSPTGDVASRLAQAQDKISAAARGAGRDPGAVSLIAVTKTIPAQLIEDAIAAGQRLFGENRVQEAKAKWPEIKERHPGIELHLIGPLQSNKAREAVALFDVIHTVDRLKIARALAEEIARDEDPFGYEPDSFHPTIRDEVWMILEGHSRSWTSGT